MTTSRASTPARGPAVPGGESGARLAGVAARHPAAAALVTRLIDLAPDGLARAHRPEDGGFAQTVWGRHDGTARREGANLRYAAIAALGLHQLPVDVQRDVLGGGTAAQVVEHAVRRAATSTDPGAVALAAWAAAEVRGELAADLFGRLRDTLSTRSPLPTVDIAWMLTAAVAAAPHGDTAEVLGDTVLRLRQRQSHHGLFAHVLAPRRDPGLRGHVGSFADQVYPLQALARASRHTGDPELLEAADRTAAQLCDVQGADGQWWWWYDARTGTVAERYPVYSVHQHAMAPMVLLDLLDAGGDDHRGAIATGLGWLTARPEVHEDLIADDLGLVWRKVGRREPRKAARTLAFAATTVRAGWQVPGLDRLLPPRVVDRECRPYELGWLLYAWLTPGPTPARPHLHVVPTDPEPQP